MKYFPIGRAIRVFKFIVESPTESKKNKGT